MRFIGNIEARLDAKNRVFVPAVFRRRLLETVASEGVAGTDLETPSLTLYVRRDVYQACLVLYPESVWEDELSTLRSRLNKWNPDQQEVYRQFMLEAETVEMDSSGRILLPRRLLAQVGIEKEVRFLGVDNTIEIWPKASLERPRVEEAEFRRQLQALMGSTTNE